MGILAFVLVLCSTLLAWFLSVAQPTVSLMTSQTLLEGRVISTPVQSMTLAAINSPKEEKLATAHPGCDCTECRKIVSQALQGKLPTPEVLNFVG